MQFCANSFLKYLQIRELLTHLQLDKSYEFYINKKSINKQYAYRVILLRNFRLAFNVGVWHYIQIR